VSRYSSYRMNIANRSRQGNLTWVALADPTRRAILERLAGGELRVTDLAEPFDISLNSVSKHIRVLERTRLVQRRRLGREHFICLTPEPLEEARGWIEKQQRSWKARLQALDAFLRAQDERIPTRKRTKETR